MISYFIVFKAAPEKLISIESGKTVVYLNKTMPFSMR